MTRSSLDDPSFSVQHAQRFLQAEASLRRRLIHAALLAISAGVVVILSALWITEPALPKRTHLAFGAMIGIGLSWLLFHGWVLLHRQPLLAIDRVIAGRLALVFSALFLVGGVVIAAQRTDWPGVFTVVIVGGMLVAAAGMILARASRTRRALLLRRDELMQRLASAPTPE